MKKLKYEVFQSEPVTLSVQELAALQMLVAVRQKAVSGDPKGQLSSSITGRSLTHLSSGL